MRKKHITIKDVARELKVNIATVSRALNDQEGVSDKLREVIKKKASEMGYKPNALARSLVMNTSSTIAFVAPDYSNPFFVEVAHAIRNHIYPLGYTLVMCDTDWDFDLEVNQLKYLEQQRVDGVIMKSARSDFSHVRQLPFPVAMISVEYSDAFSTIDTDNFYGGFLATEALVRAGYKRIAYFGSLQDPPTSNLRRAGFKAALKHYGLPCWRQYVQDGNFSIDSGRELMRLMLQLPTPPDAVFCINDLSGIGAMDVALEHGLNIPDEFGIIGYDNMTMTSLSSIQLSTVVQQGSVLGTEIAAMLVRAIRSGADALPEHRFLEPRLLLRKTTRPLPTYKPYPADKLKRPGRT